MPRETLSKARLSVLYVMIAEANSWARMARASAAAGMEPIAYTAARQSLTLRRCVMALRKGCEIHAAL